MNYFFSLLLLPLFVCQILPTLQKEKLFCFIYKPNKPKQTNGLINVYIVYYKNDVHISISKST